MPKANPEYFFESIPQFSKTLGSTIPEPKISNQPDFHEISISALGS